MERSGSQNHTAPDQLFPVVKSMTHSQESRVSSSQDILRLSEENFSSVSALVNKINSCTTGVTEANDDDKSGKVSAATSNQEEKSLETTFPWIRSFGDLCRTSVSNKSLKVLENLLTVYLQHVSIDVKSCYTKPNRAAKLKRCMNEALLFFHMFYQDVREPMEHSFYLSKMTDLMSMYLDMEIIASRRKKETTRKVVSKLTSSLFILLDHSERHMLDAILRAKLITKANKEICIPVLGKLMTSMRLAPLYELFYVRCLLVFKLWKKLAIDGEEKKRITVLALKKLTVPKNFLDKSKLLGDVLPRIPKTKKNISMFFMQAKFNWKSACKAFLKICRESESLGEKSLFYGEHGESQTLIGEKDLDVGGSRNIFHNIWSSLSVCTNSSGLNSLGRGNKEKSVLNSKKEKKKAKNKSKGEKIRETSEEKNKKKKKVKKKDSNDSISVLDGISSGKPQVFSGKEVKKKKKKSALNSGDGKTADSVVSNEQQLEIVIKTENIQDSYADVCKEMQQMNQVNEINSVGILKEVVTEEMKDTVPLPMPVMVETSKHLRISDSLEQVNQVNSMSSESQRVENHAAESTNSANVNVSGIELQVNVLESVAGELEGKLAPAMCSSEVPASVANVNKEISDSVIVASSSSTSLVDCLVNTSHPSAVIENEAVPSVISGAHTSSTDMLPRKIVQSYLETSEASDDSEVTNIVSPREVIPPDSSIQLEEPVHVGAVATVVVPTSGVDDSYFNRICMGYDSDEEILSDLQQQRTIPGDQDLTMPRNERDLLPRDTVPSNIFATENSDVLFEVLGGSHLDGRVLCSEDVPVENSFLCVGDDGTELESPPIEPINENEKLSLESMISNIRSNKDSGSFAHFGTERQDWSHTSSESKLLYSNCDYMFSGTNQSRYTSIVPVHGNILSTTNFMDNDDDDDDDDKVISTDDEEVYEYQSSSSSSSPQMKVRGGKVGSHSFSTLDNEKDMLNSSSSISDSPPSLKSVYMQNESPYKKVNSRVPSFSSRNSSNRPRVGEKIPAPFLVTSVQVSPITTATTTISCTPAITTLKTVNVNLSNCLETYMVNNKKKSRTSKSNNSGRYKDSSVNVSQNKYPDVVRDAHEATEKVDKSSVTRACPPQKSARGTVPSESGNNASGKSVISNIEEQYCNVPVIRNTCIPSASIPYPQYPAPFTAKTCQCTACYAHYLHMLNYSALPTQYNSSNEDFEKTKNREASLEKSDNEELIRKIEESLSELQKENPKLNSDVTEKESESKYKSDLSSSLPLKKRLKALPVEETKLETVFDLSKSSQAESFPSYPSKPMISIAELQLDKMQQSSKLVRTLVPNSQKYPQYGSSYYNRLQLQQLTESYIKGSYAEQYPHYQRYPLAQTGMSNELPVCKVEGADAHNNSIVNGMPAFNPGSSSIDVKATVNNGLINRNSESLAVGYTNNYSNYDKSNVPSHLKTPGQYKDVPPTREYSVVPKSELPKAMCPPLIPIPDYQYYKTPPPKYPYINVKQDLISIPTQPNNTVEFYMKQTVLDLSKQSSKENKSRQSTRRKRNTNPSQSKPRNSKRQKRESVIQNSDVNKTDCIYMKEFTSTSR